MADGVVGQLIGARYRITDRIGKGGMGVVYRAVDELLRRPIALKFLPPDVAHDVERLAQFRNEARVLSALNHPNIVTIFEVGQANDTPFIAMEFVEGETLRTRLCAGRLSADIALDVVKQTARALAAAHQKGIVHRDIKPENVMIRPDGYVKVLDFGLAVLRHRPESGQSLLTAGYLETVAAGVAGTPAYMSPEQIEGAPLDPRSDIFSVGVVFCEAVTGTNPFQRSGVIETASAIGRTPAPAADVIKDLRPDLSATIVRALQKDPAGRYQTVADFIADLDRTPDRSAASSRTPSGPRWSALAAAIAFAAVGITGVAGYRRSEHRHWVHEQAIPEIVRLTGDHRSAAAFPLIHTAEAYLPNDPDLARAVADATRVVSIRSSPPGAEIDVEDYLFPNEGWLRLGTTPIDKIRVPSGYLRWKVSRAGDGESITAPATRESMDFDLGRAASAPAGMVPVDGGMWTNSIGFLGWLGPYDLPAFFVDRFEVTNRQYQEFVDKGGYTSPDYWKLAFVRDGRVLTWTDAMQLLRDQTGRFGPSTWEAGHYPEGKGDYPVTGISWFEAAAYAEFAGKSLPVLAQGFKLAPASADPYAVHLSNLSGNIARVGEFQGLGEYGTYDMVGNAREWYVNASSDGSRYALGRQASSYGPEALPPFDRSELNGFRCVQNAGPIPADAAAPRTMLRRDFSKAQPVSEEVFRVYRNMYAYDRTPLDATLDGAPVETADWTVQKVTIDAAYAHERMAVFLFLPRHTRPPYQTIVFFPSARVNFLTSSDKLGDLSFMDYVVKSGRAVAYPIYYGRYERQTTTPAHPGPTLKREVLVNWSKDLGRSIDYLASRPDIDAARIGYLGVSQGSAYGVILTSIEDRLKAVVFLDGGFFQQERPIAGMDQTDFARRLTKPVLMVNGRFDATFPFESAQLPLFRMIGTPVADKRHVVFDTPHDVRLRRADLVTEVLAWYDKYLGHIQ